jgi:hypothetical protein
MHALQSESHSVKTDAFGFWKEDARMEGGCDGPDHLIFFVLMPETTNDSKAKVFWAVC